MSRIEIGQPFEAAGWFLPGGKSACKREIEAAFLKTSDEGGLRFGHIRWRVLEPGEGETPEPEKTAPRGVKLLVGEARVIGYKAQIVAPTSAFVHDLDPKDLARLRQITRAAHARHNPGAAPLTDAQCDAVINEIGPESAMKAVRSAVDRGQVQ